MRKYLYVWVHEAGHAWNLLHSWDKARPSVAVLDELRLEVRRRSTAPTPSGTGSACASTTKS